MSSDRGSSILDSLDFWTIQKALGRIRRGQEQGLNEELRESARDLDEEITKKEVRVWLDELGEEATAAAESAFKRQAKKEILRQRERRLYYLEGVEIEGGKAQEQLLESLSTKLSVNEVMYYDSHFKFSNNSAYLYSLSEIDGVLSASLQRTTGADTPAKRFQNEVRESNVDDIYAEAAGRMPAPILGKLEASPKPRIVWFEDSEHVYIEYWSLGQEDQVFDGNEGTSITYRPRIRTGVRIHLDTNTVTISGGKDRESHRNSIIRDIETLAGGPEAATDGGTTTTAETIDPRARGIRLKEEDIWNVIDNVGIISTLESFKGRRADVRFSSVKNRDVRNAESYEEVKNQPLRLANIQVFMNDINGASEFISPDYAEERFDLDDDVTRDEIEELIEEEGDYLDVSHITVSLNADRDTIHIDKERWTPSARRAVFHQIEDEINT